MEATEYDSNTHLRFAVERCSADYAVAVARAIIAERPGLSAAELIEELVRRAHQLARRLADYDKLDAAPRRRRP